MKKDVIATEKLSDGDPSGPTLFCIPGAMCPPEIFLEMAKNTAYIAHGIRWLEGSGPHDLISVAKRICEATKAHDRVILIGHSIGAVLAVLATSLSVTEGSRNVVGMVLSNSGANTKGHGDIDTIINRVLLEWGENFWYDFVHRCIGTSVTPLLWEKLRSYPSCLDPGAVAEAMRSQKTIDLIPILQSLPKIPSAIVHGRLDRARTIAHATELANSVVGGAVHILDTGHTSAAEAPEKFAEIVKHIGKSTLDMASM
jgi:3-oxoadipate enol-lactonase